MIKKKRLFTLTDWIIGSITLLMAIFFVYRLSVGLNYNWAWSKIPQFLFRYDVTKGEWVSNILMNGFYVTLRLSIWGIILAAFFGVLMGICRSVKIHFFRWTAITYVETMRNLPPLVIIFIMYFFIGDQILAPMDLSYHVEGLSSGTQSVIAFLFAEAAYLPAFISALLTLAIFEGAYITEIVRAGIASVDKGQWDASHALGMTWYQQMRHIILPQTFQRIMPPLAGQVISLIKDSSIVSIISIQELTFQGTELMQGTMHTIEIWTVVTLMYLTLTLPCSLLVEQIERYMAKSDY